MQEESSSEEDDSDEEDDSEDVAPAKKAAPPAGAAGKRKAAAISGKADEVRSLICGGLGQSASAMLLHHSCSSLNRLQILSSLPSRTSRRTMPQLANCDPEGQLDCTSLLLLIKAPLLSPPGAGSGE